jgi:hypothetical protein
MALSDARNELAVVGSNWEAQHLYVISQIPNVKARTRLFSTSPPHDTLDRIEKWEVAHLLSV